MVPTPEKEPQQAPEGVQEVVDVPESPPHIEKSGVSVTPTQFTAQVTDDQGQPIITPTPTRTVEPPASEEQLKNLSKGTPTASITWLATFWLRMMKKARHFGWKMIGKGGSK
jgi:hypothetical protein